MATQAESTPAQVGVDQGPAQVGVDQGPPQSAYAFGLALESGFAIPGLPASESPDVLPRTRLELAPAAKLDERWTGSEPERILEEWIGDTEVPARTIDHDERLGYKLYARHFGFAEIAPDGAEIRCAPPEVSPWRWQRFLVGRVLPWASLLRGHEVLHAGAVALDGSAVAFVAASGGGKTSLAVRLVLDGAGFLTDDVLALELRNDALVAHPGAAIVAVREAERAAIDSAGWSRLGQELGTEDKSYVVVEREPRARPLRALYFLRAGSPGAGSGIETLAPDPRLLLSSTFVFGVRTPERLRRQLDVCARIADEVPTFSATVDPRAGSSSLAEAVQEHARGILSSA
jgi:hypothetical protein